MFKDLNIKYEKSFFLLFILICFQKLTLTNVGELNLKLFHVFAGIFVVYMAVNRKAETPGKLITIYYIYIIMHSLFATVRFGFSGLIFNYIFGYIIMMAIITFGKSYTMDMWINILTKVAGCIIVIVVVNILLNYNAIIIYMNSPWMAHPVYDTVFGGGINLEATWVAILGFAFGKHRLKWLYIASSTAISAIISSRTGLIINALVILWIYLPMLSVKHAARLIITTTLLVIAILIVIKNGYMDLVLERFADIGEDSGSMGRLYMWERVGEAIKQYPLGCGLGNCIDALEEATGLKYGDNNLHNLYFQNILELGWIGGLAYIAIVIGFVLKEIRNIFNNPFVAMLFTYIITSFLQFRGGEPLLFVFLGIYIALYRQTRNRLIDTKLNY